MSLVIYSHLISQKGLASLSQQSNLHVPGSHNFINISNYLNCLANLVGIKCVLQFRGLHVT